MQMEFLNESRELNDSRLYCESSLLEFRKVHYEIGHYHTFHLIKYSPKT